MNEESLPIILRSLNLPAMAQLHPDAIVRAEEANWGYLRFLHYLAETEANDRLARKIERLIKEAGLPPGQTFDTLDRSKMPDKARRQLANLLSGDFVRRGDTLLAFGLPGRGKTAFCAALARALIEKHQLKVLFLPAFKLVSRLLVAKRDLKLDAYLAKLHRLDAIIVDDLGSYVEQSTAEIDVLFSFFSDRYEKQRSVIVTSNLVFSQWDKIFKNPMTAQAVVDRLVHAPSQHLRCGTFTPSRLLDQPVDAARLHNRRPI
jgi:DNA replication protein DnaC